MVSMLLLLMASVLASIAAMAVERSKASEEASI
jgi:hypothetical protein